MELIWYPLALLFNLFQVVPLSVIAILNEAFKIL